MSTEYELPADLATEYDAWVAETATEAEVPPASTTTSDDEEPLRRARVTWADTIEPEPVVWAWQETGHGRIPSGSMSIAAGREGTGKSSFGIWLAARITTGTLPGSFLGEPRRVLYLAVEDSWRHTLAPRLIAAGADLSRVGRFDVVNCVGEEVTLSLPHDNALLADVITEHDIALVVIDPLMSVIGERIDTHRERDVRSALDPLARLAERTDCVLLGIAHFNKGASTDAASLITGSGAFKNVPRSVFGFARDEADENDGRVMSQVKNSLGRDDLPSLSYRIDSAEVPTKKGIAHTGKFVFTGTSDRSVADVLRDRGRGGEERDEQKSLDRWLLDLLADGPVKATEVYRAGDAAGYSKDQLKRAKHRLGIEARKAGMNAGWSWSVPTEERTKNAKSAGNLLLLPSHSSAHPSPEPATCSTCGTDLGSVDIAAGNGTCGTCELGGGDLA